MMIANQLYRLQTTYRARIAPTTMVQLHCLLLISSILM
jgi:hypothetical protein